LAHDISKVNLYLWARVIFAIVADSLMKFEKITHIHAHISSRMIIVIYS